MNVVWKCQLSYDAAKDYYELKSEIFNLTILHQEQPDFRTCLLVLLLLHDIENLESYVESTISFDITLDEKQDPVEHLRRIITKHFTPGDFGYMILASKDNPQRLDYLVKEKSHEVYFQSDLMKATLLKNRIVLLSKSPLDLE